MTYGGGIVHRWGLMASLRSFLTRNGLNTKENNVHSELPFLIRLLAGKSSQNSHRGDQLRASVVVKEDVQHKKEGDTTNGLQSAIKTVNSYIPQVSLHFGTKDDKKQDPDKSQLPKWISVKREGVSKVSINSRTRHLVRGLSQQLLPEAQLRRLQDLCAHLKTYPQSRGQAVKCSVIPHLLSILHHSQDAVIKEEVYEALSLVGYTLPVASHGIRVLSLDGGGTRGLIALQILREIEAKTGKQIHELFDLVCGVSTGAIITVLAAVRQLSMEHCERLYADLSGQVFNRTTIKGTAGLVWNSSYYDSEFWDEVLKKTMGERVLIETSRSPKTPKICLVSTQANATWIKAYLFRNYNLPYRAAGHHDGTSSCVLWEGVRASAAAPGYFSEFRLGDLVLVDGGVMVNNPTAIAVHEAKQLWPRTPLQCVVSISSGRYDPVSNIKADGFNWAARIRTVVNSATDTEGIHSIMNDILPGNVYFRFNPYISEEIGIDEIREEKLDLILEDTCLYVSNNQKKFESCAKSLLRKKTAWDHIRDYCKMQMMMHNWSV